MTVGLSLYSIAPLTENQGDAASLRLVPRHAFPDSGLISIFCSINCKSLLLISALIGLHYIFLDHPNQFAPHFLLDNFSHIHILCLFSMSTLSSLFMLQLSFGRVSSAQHLVL